MKYLIYRIKVRRAEALVRKAEAALLRAIPEIDRFAIVSDRSAAVYRAFEAYAERIAIKRHSGRRV